MAGLTPAERREIDRLRGLRHGGNGDAAGSGSSQPVWLAAADPQRLRKDGGTSEFAANGTQWRVSEFFQAQTLTDMASSVLGDLHRAQEAARTSASSAWQRANAAAATAPQQPGQVDCNMAGSRASVDIHRTARPSVGAQHEAPPAPRRSSAWDLLRRLSLPLLGSSAEPETEDGDHGPLLRSPSPAPSPPAPRVTLQDLPDELVALILSKLYLADVPRVVLVCARFAAMQDAFVPQIAMAQGPDTAAAIAQRSDVPHPIRASLTRLLVGAKSWSHVADILATACSRGETELVQIICSGAELHRECWLQGLVRACEYAHEDAVELLLTHSMVDPAADGCAAVRAACEGGSVRILKTLLADPRVHVADCGVACFKAALAHGNIHLAELILQHPEFDPSLNDNELIRWVCKFGRADAVSMLFDDGRVDVTVNEQEAFRIACAQGHSAVVRLLLAVDAVDPSAQDNYAVKLAASNGHFDVLALLLADPRVDPTAGNNHAARFACMEGHGECVSLLLADGRADFAADENQALRWAAAGGRVDIVRLLLDSGKVDVHACDNSAVRLAHQYGHTEVLRLLMRDDPRTLGPRFSG